MGRIHDLEVDRAERKLSLLLYQRLDAAAIAALHHDNVLLREEADKRAEVIGLGTRRPVVAPAPVIVTGRTDRGDDVRAACAAAVMAGHRVPTFAETGRAG